MLRKNNIWHRFFLFTLFVSFFSSAPLSADSPSKPVFPLKNKGTEFPVRYEKYGIFTGVGTKDFKYKITDRKGLTDAMGEGLFPNNGSTLSDDPAYLAWREHKPPNTNPWDYVQTGDPQTEFYVWAQTNGANIATKLFYMAQALAEGGHVTQALKAYHAVLVHFPKEPCWSSDHTFVWYLAGEALSRIEALGKVHPEIGFRLQGAEFKVINGNDTDLKNDIFMVSPGEWVKRTAAQKVDLASLPVLQERGHGKVRLIQFENKHWQLQVKGAPFFIRGITYNPTPLGTDLSDGRGNNWMFEDSNTNEKIDAPYESWVDANKNSLKDPDENSVGDFELMRRMGVNAIRIYRYSTSLDYDPDEFNKPLLRDLAKTYGIRVIMGDFLGAYTVGSGASWDEGTDYTNEEHKENMKHLVKAYVLDHKDEPYVLLWVLGNENLMSGEYGGVNATRTKAAAQVKEYLSFVNEVTDMIHQLDPDHPVAVGNLALNNLDEHAKYAPSVDIFGANSYSGALGFGDLWKKVQKNFDRPVLITEFGCDAFNSKVGQEDQKAQADYHKGAWNDIRLNAAGGPEEGNAIGGVIFEYLDEWWKSQQGSWTSHDESEDSPMAFPDGWSSEEWLGTMSQGDGSQSPLLRQPRSVYFLYKDRLWKEKN